MKYFLVDSGKQQKLEKFGDYLLVRPCSQAIWEPKLPYEKWNRANGIFTREKENKWTISTPLPKSWIVEIEQIQFKISPTDFGHLGVFPEHAGLWKWMEKRIQEAVRPNILNLFAYSGGATLAAAKAGARVCHLDSSKGMVAWARENAALNRLTDAPIRWIVEDVVKFLRREIKRGSRYEGIILDPPSFGRGNQGEVFKIERDLKLILELCRDLLSSKPLFLILSTHTPGFTPTVMHHILSQTMQGIKGKIEAGEMLLSGQDTLDLPCGSYARWQHGT